MKLSVAANYDLQIVPQLADLEVADIYGKLPHDLAGGGRSSYCSVPVTFGKLRDYTAELKKYGITFTYLLNSACLSNHEWDRRWQKKLFRFVEQLQNIEVASLTISTPLIFKIIKNSFPEFKFKVGIFAQIDTPLRAKYWQDLGADMITLESFSINRNFDKLEKIRRTVTCQLQLIVNHPCLPNCPMQVYHQNGLSHSSTGDGKLFIDYCFLTCCYERLKEPSLFIKSQWIRPEDLHQYEKIGYGNFKLLERNIPSSPLLKRVRAYRDRRSPPNFADLILPYGFAEKTNKGKFWLIRNFFKPMQIRPSKLKHVYRLAQTQGILSPMDETKITIDPSQFPNDFLEHFKAIDCSSIDCKTCRYCERIAERAVFVDKQFRRDVLRYYEDFDEQITTGKFWDV